MTFKRSGDQTPVQPIAMPDAAWPKVREIFDAALRRRPEERRSFVSEACGDDKTLLAEVQSLLSSHDSAKSFMETPAVAKVADMIEPATKKLEAGSSFGHYEIIKQIGAGGMGEVYLGRDTKLDRKVALKFLPGAIAQDRERLRRFQQEARATSALNHPNIFTVFEIGEADGRHYIATEFIEGETLGQLMAAKPLKLGETLNIAEQIASALSAAHRAGIVHRDIKPENIMIREDGLVKVLDFGLAKLTERTDDAAIPTEALTRPQLRTMPGMVMGTPRYMSPEQAKGEPVDERTDIFSFGVVIYEMLAGKPPFAGKNAIETLGSILNKEAVPLSRHMPNVPHEIERVINKTLRKNREERYQSAKDVLIDLKDFKQGLEFSEKLERSAAPSNNKEATGGDAAVVTEKQNAQTTSRAEHILREMKRHKRGVSAVLAGLLLSAIGLGYWFYLNRVASTNPKQIKSIAVLPFENLSGDGTQEYFADGMTEALIGNLSQIRTLKVISRTSVMRYKRSGKSVPEIATELGVDGIIEGSVQRSGDRIRITTKLIHAATDSPIWTRTYERSLSDILKLQSEIAQVVAGEIRIQLTPEEQLRFGKTKSMDPRATEAFLLGRHYFHKWTRESERQAVEQFQKAVSFEPEYAEAWAGLADAWTVRAMVGDISVPEAEKPTREAAIRALEIDPQNSAAHISMCFIHNNYDFDWTRSENSCKRGIELDPNNAKGHFAYAYMLARVERWDEMAEQMETAMSLDPAEPWWASVYGSFLTQARRFEAAERQFKRAIEIDPNWRFAHRGLANLHVEHGRFDEALKLAEKWVNNPLFMAYIYARKGDRQKALDSLSRSSDQDRFQLALVYTALDDFDKAFEVINQSLDRREGFMFGYADYNVLDRLKSDPRWKDVSRRLNLPAKS